MTLGTAWTNTTIVKTYLQGNASNVADADIVTMIRQIQGGWKTIMKIPDTFSFSDANDSHLMLRDVVTLETVLRILQNMAISYQSLEQNALACDVINDRLQFLISKLDNPATRSFIVNGGT